MTCERCGRAFDPPFGHIAISDLEGIDKEGSRQVIPGEGDRRCYVMPPLPRFDRCTRGAEAPANIVFHDLRHFFASLLIRHGESVQTVQAMLGHASAAETLDTYSHLWPDSDDRTRGAVDAVLGSTKLTAAAL